MDRADGCVMMYGKPVAAAIEQQVAAAVEAFTAHHKVVPTLGIVQVGDNPASDRYVRKKIEACARLNMRAELFRFAATISANALKEEVQRLSLTREIHGILVQLPLPRHIEEPESGTNKFDIFDAIAAEKDVDGISRHSVPELYRAQPDRMRFLACTPLAVRRMMSFYGIQTEGKLAVVVGRNDITAKPMLLMLGGRMCNAAAIWCHRYVPKSEQKMLIRSADLLVTSVGSTAFRITADMLKRGVVVFDIATRVDASGKLSGDVELPTAREVASFITPVPGGVGPVTVAALTENLLRSAQFAVGASAPGYVF